MLSPSEKRIINKYIPDSAIREIGLDSAVAILADNLPAEFWHFWENERYWDLDDLFYSYDIGCQFNSQRLMDISFKKIIKSVSKFFPIGQLYWCLEFMAPSGSTLKHQQEEWLKRSVDLVIINSDYKTLNDVYFYKLWSTCPDNYLKYRLMILQQIIESEISRHEKCRLEQLLELYRSAVALNDNEILFKIKSIFISAKIDFSTALAYWLVAMGLEAPSPICNFDGLLHQGILDQEFFIILFRQKMEETVDKFMLFLKQKKYDNGECWSLARRLPAGDLLSIKLWQLQYEITDRISNSDNNQSAYQMWCLIFRDSPSDSEAEQKAGEFLSANPPSNWYNWRWFLMLNNCGKHQAQRLFDNTISDWRAGRLLIPII